jgi:hypothetical protein
MRIFGDDLKSEFNTIAKEPGVLFGKNDVFLGSKKSLYSFHFSLFGSGETVRQYVPKLYLHIPTNRWTSLTGKFRQYCLPWRWKTAYLDRQDGTDPCKILICTAIKDASMTSRIKMLLGKSLMITNLINTGAYDEFFGRQFLRIKGQKESNVNRVYHPLGKFFGIHLEFNSDQLCPIHCSQGIYSNVKYFFLKKYSTYWKEVAVHTSKATENILIRKDDEPLLFRLDPIAKFTVPHN